MNNAQQNIKELLTYHLIWAPDQRHSLAISMYKLEPTYRYGQELNTGLYELVWCLSLWEYSISFTIQPPLPSLQIGQGAGSRGCGEDDKTPDPFWHPVHIPSLYRMAYLWYNIIVKMENKNMKHLIQLHYEFNVYVNSHYLQWMSRLSLLVNICCLLPSYQTSPSPSWCPMCMHNKSSVWMLTPPSRSMDFLLLLDICLRINEKTGQ